MENRKRRNKGDQVQQNGGAAQRKSKRIHDGANNTENTSNGISEKKIKSEEEANTSVFDANNDKKSTTANGTKKPAEKRRLIRIKVTPRRGATKNALASPAYLSEVTNVMNMVAGTSKQNGQNAVNSTVNAISENDVLAFPHSLRGPTPSTIDTNTTNYAFFNDVIFPMTVNPINLMDNANENKFTVKPSTSTSLNNGNHQINVHWPNEPGTSKNINAIAATLPNQNYLDLLKLEQSVGVVPNADNFKCTMCLLDVQPNDGIILRECLHHFCKNCIVKWIIDRLNDDATIKCPFMVGDLMCGENIQDREIRGLLSSEQYDQYLQRTIQFAEKNTKNSFHCKLPNCDGWCEVEDQISFYQCNVCDSMNCINCEAIHTGRSCQQYKNGLLFKHTIQTANTSISMNAATLPVEANTLKPNEIMPNTTKVFNAAVQVNAPLDMGITLERIDEITTAIKRNLERINNNVTNLNMPNANKIEMNNKLSKGFSFPSLAFPSSTSTSSTSLSIGDWRDHGSHLPNANIPATSKAINDKSVASTNGIYLEPLKREEPMGMAENLAACVCCTCFVVLNIKPNDGIILRNCQHRFCKNCILQSVLFLHSKNLQIKCPYMAGNFACEQSIQDRDLVEFLTKEQYDEYCLKIARFPDRKAKNKYTCNLPNCNGWFKCESELNYFQCPSCEQINCNNCRAIHMGMNCQRYQVHLLKIKAQQNAIAAPKTQLRLNSNLNMPKTTINDAGQLNTLVPTFGLANHTAGPKPSNINFTQNLASSFDNEQNKIRRQNMPVTSKNSNSKPTATITKASTFLAAMGIPCTSGASTSKLMNTSGHSISPCSTAAIPFRANQNYLDLLKLEESLSNVPNTEVFDCAICFTDIAPNDGIVLRNCLHRFCKECTVQSIVHSENNEIKCPYMDGNFTCEQTIQDREIRGLLSKEQYDKYLQKMVQFAEKNTKNAFHCKLPNCEGWCEVEDQVNYFHCPICNSINCINCGAIHTGKNCRQYQDSLLLNEADQKSKMVLQKLIDSGTAMRCPKCKIIIVKREGCDNLLCTMCRTEICWVTKGPRWGPKGRGDTSAGCKCNLSKKCHPKCRNCH